MKIQDLFSDSDLFLFNKLLDEPVEYGGAISCQPQAPYYKVNRQSLVKGDNNMGVDLNPTAFNFHTHPRKFYRTEKTFSAYFSGVDIKYIVRNIAYDLRQHFLITHEGIYVIECSKLFRTIYLTVPERCKSKMVNFLFDFFYKLEKKRRSPKNVMKMNRETLPIHRNVITKIKDLKISNLPDCYKNFFDTNANRTLFTLKFFRIDW